MKKIVYYNFLFFFIFFIFIEIFFGYWFDKNNFGFFIRNERLIEKHFSVIHNEKKYAVIYKRNFYGFRGEEVNPEEIQVVFEGGSTGNQKFIPEELTVVGLLNNYLKKDKIKVKIHNASTDGKTIKGYINDFDYWFSKINNFNPKIFIFYMGINDSTIFEPIYGYQPKFDTGQRTGFAERLADYFKNNSITYELVLKIYNKYFSKLKIQNNPNHLYQDLYIDFNYVNYFEAKNKFQNQKLTENEIYLSKYFKLQLKYLKKIIIKNDIIPIFITQIQFDGLNNKKLYLINELIKEFALNNNYYLISLDEKINNIKKYDFYDPIHVKVSGSKKIADIIYPKLSKFLINNL